MITVNDETWDGADGDPWPSPWVFRGGYSFQTEHTPPTIVNGAGRLPSGTGNSQGWGYSLGQVDLPGNFGDFDITCKMTFQDINLMEQYGDICWGLQNGGSLNQEGILSFEMSRYADVWQARIWDASIGGPVGTYQNFANGDNLGGVPIWMRVKREGTTISGKAWKVSDAEPDWTCVASGNAHYADTGALSLVTTAGPEDTNQYVDYDDFTVRVPGLGYIAGKPVFKAFLGAAPLAGISLG